MLIPRPSSNTDERNDIAHRLFLLPAVHHLKRKLLNNGDKMQQIMAEYLTRISEKDALIIDLGCGTGKNALLCKDMGTYYGVDLNPRHLETANREHSAYATFIEGDAASVLPQIRAMHPEPGRPLVILMVGFLHHVSDAAVANIIDGLRAAQQSPCFILTVDPVKTENPPLIERLLMWLDRGRFIRSASQYRQLLAHGNHIVESTTYNDFLNVPYHHHVGFVHMKGD